MVYTGEGYHGDGKTYCEEESPLLYFVLKSNAVVEKYRENLYL